MNTPQAQIKINLPLPLKEFAESKANTYGMPLAGYIKHLILSDVKDAEYPVFEMSARSKKMLKKALEERDAAVAVKDVSDFFKNL